jgi:hypothetical protein
MTIPSDISTNTKSQNHNHYYNQYHEGILEIANSLLKMFLSQVVDNTMVAVVEENKPVCMFSQE